MTFADFPNRFSRLPVKDGVDFPSQGQDAFDKSSWRSHPQSIDVIRALVPVFIGTIVFAAAYLAKTIALTLGLLSGDAAGPTFGIAALAGLSSFALLRQLNPIYVTRGQNAMTNVLVMSARLAIAFIIILAVIYALGIDDRYPFVFVSVWYLTSIAIMAGALAVLGLYVRLLLAEGRMVQRVALYGGGELAAHVARLLLDNDNRTSIIGFYDDPATTRSGAIGALTGGIQDLMECARSDGCDRIVVTLPFADRKRVNNVMKRLEELPTTVQLCPDPHPLPCNIRGADKLGSLLLLDVQQHPLGARGIIFKTIMDYALGTLALICLMPVMILIAIAIKFDSPGPIFFKQSRGGYRNRTFRVYKFRTMRVLEDGPLIVQAKRDDKRITRVGRFLRRTSLDELPQLFNVLRGELSLVGPRPHALAHDEFYGKIVERYASRQRMKPGITGWAQVNGYRSETRDPELMRQRIRHDLYYIENWSPWLDVQILFRTVGVVFSDKHAY